MARPGIEEVNTAVDFIVCFLSEPLSAVAHRSPYKGSNHPFAIKRTAFCLAICRLSAEKALSRRKVSTLQCYLVSLSSIYCAIVMCPCIDCTEWNEWYLCLWRLSSVHQIAQSSSMWNIGGQSLCLLYQCCIIFVVLTLYDLLLHAPCEHLELLGKVICLQQDSEEGNLQERKCFLTSGIYWSPLKT